jgi:hypothetical protein
MAHDEAKSAGIPIPMSPFENRDLYGILEIPRDADESTIRRAYKRGALKYHPGEYFVFFPLFLFLVHFVANSEQFLTFHLHFRCTIWCPCSSCPQISFAINRQGR